MNSAPCATSISARKATRPTAIRQYRLRYHAVLVPSAVEGLNISCLVSRAPHRENHFRLRRIPLGLFPQPLDQGVHAAHGDERLILPDPTEERLPAEHDARAGKEHVEKLKFVRGQIDVRVVYANPPPRRIHFDVLVADRLRRFPRR